MKERYYYYKIGYTRIERKYARVLEVYPQPAYWKLDKLCNPEGTVNDIKITRLNRKPAMVSFIPDEHGRGEWLAWGKGLRSVGRPKGSCIPKSKRRINLTLTLKPDAIKNIKALPPRFFRDELESKYCDK